MEKISFALTYFIFIVVQSITGKYLEYLAVEFNIDVAILVHDWLARNMIILEYFHIAQAILSIDDV